MSKLLAARRLQSAILCCCQSQMLGETSINTLPPGMMNFHEAQFELMAPEKPLRERVERSVLIDSIRIIGYGLQQALQKGVNPANINQLASVIRGAQIASIGLPVRGKNVTLQFDKGGNLQTPMSLTNLINGSWVSVGVYDPVTDEFHPDHTPVWPSTGVDIPIDIMSCGNGHIVVPMKDHVPFCRVCAQGYYSALGSLTSCQECAPGQSGNLFISVGLTRISSSSVQACFSRSRAHLPASSVIASGTIIKNCRIRLHARFVHSTPSGT
jgi:hypothetical protein